MEEKRLKFKDQWNLFQLNSYYLLQKQLSDDEDAIEEFQNKLSSIKTNEDRIKYVLRHELLSKALDEYVDKLFDSSSTNCSCDTQCFDASGQMNECDDLAQQMSVLLREECQPNDEDVGHLARRRAKQFYLLNRFEECAEEIIEFQIEDTEMLDMKSKCNAILETSTEIVRSEEIRVADESEQLNGASNSVEMTIDQSKGRLIRSKTNIEKGTIVISETAYTHWLRPTLYHLYCYACLKNLNYRYFYCGQCLKVRFCSLKCLNEAWQTFHKVECEFMHALRHLAMGHFSLRMALMDGVGTLIETAKKENCQLPIGTFHNNYESVHSLVGNEYLRDSTLFLSGCVSGALLALCADRMSLISRDSNDFYLFAGVMFKHMMQTLINTFVIYDCKLTKSDLENVSVSIFDRKRKKVGVALFATSSLLSHSCDNNCIKLFIGSKILVIPLRSIEENEEVTINYGVTCHVTKDKSKRNEFLSGNFGFNCKCNVCKPLMICDH